MFFFVCLFHACLLYLYHFPSFLPPQFLLIPQLPFNLAVSLTLLLFYTCELYANALWYVHLVVLLCKFIELLLFGIRQPNKGFSFGEDCFALFEASLITFSSLFKSEFLWNFAIYIIISTGITIICVFFRQP